MISESTNSELRPNRVTYHCLPTIGSDPTLHLFLCEEKVSYCLPKTGLSPSSDYHAYYLCPQANKPAAIELAAPPQNDGGVAFWEIDQHLMPGLYGMRISSHLRTRGYTFIYLHFAGAYPLYLELHGVEYDPYDSFALGLQSWIRSTCHEHLTSGLRKSMPGTIWPLLDDWFNQEVQEQTKWNSS